MFQGSSFQNQALFRPLVQAKAVRFLELISLAWLLGKLQQNLQNKGLGARTAVGAAHLMLPLNGNLTVSTHFVLLASLTRINQLGR